MKNVFLLILLFYVGDAYSCSCWRKYVNEESGKQVEEFIGVVVGGGAVAPATPEERAKWESDGFVVTELKVINPLNSALQVGQIVEVKQSYNC